MNKADFPFFSTKNKNENIIYLDNAATTQKPKCVLDSIINNYVYYNANVHRGIYSISQKATELHEKARKKIADFINAKSEKEIIFTSGTTDSINKIAYMLENIINEGDEVLISTMEHHSNIVPWQIIQQRKKCKLKIIELKNDDSLNTNNINKIINEKTKIISLTLVSNVLGIKNNIEEIIKIAKKKNIITIVDAAQACSHIKIDVQKINCDFLVISAHKMYGPTGIGIIYGKLNILERLQPVFGGGEMIEHVSFEKTTYNTIPYKFEAGTPNFNSTPAFAKAVEYIEKCEIKNISDHEENLIKYAQQELEKVDEVHIYARKIKKISALSFNVYKNGKIIHPFDIGTLLNEQNICVRTGHHCAEPLMKHLNIPGTVRISVALYNDENDIKKFINALKKTILIL